MLNGGHRAGSSIGMGFALIAAALWGSSAAVTKTLLSHLGNIQILMCTTGVATVALLIICVIQGRLAVLRTYRPKDFATIALLGFFGVFTYRFLLQAALAAMPAQEAFILNYTWPIMVVLFAVPVLGEEFTGLRLAAVCVSFVGVGVVVTQGRFSSVRFSITGIAFALSGAVIYGLFSALGKKLNYDRFVSTLLFFAFSFVLSAITLAITSLPALSVAQIGGLVWLGVGPSALGFVAWSLALKHGRTASVSNLVLVTPFLSLVYVAVLLHEKIAPSSLVGLGLILAGILLQSTKRAARGDLTTLVRARGAPAVSGAPALKGAPVIDIHAHYERLAPTFEDNWAYNGTYVRRMNSVIASALQVRPGQLVADLGGGTGLYSEGLSRITGPNAPVYCVDPSSAMLDVAAAKANVVPVLCSAESFPTHGGPDGMPAQFDALLVRDAVHHFPDAENTIAQVARERLGPDGRILIAMLPTTLHLPLFRAARERLEAVQPDLAGIIDALARSGLDVITTHVNSSLNIPRSRYLDMVRDRYLSVLSSFDDSELDEGIEEMSATFPDRVMFIESFVFAVGRKTSACSGVTRSRSYMVMGSA